MGTAMSTAVRRDGEEVQPLDVPVTEAITTSIRAALHAATEEVLSRWRERPFGSSLLTARGHQVTSNDIEPQLERTVRDWRVRCPHGWLPPCRKRWPVTTRPGSMPRRSPT